ncbi:MAG: signal peptide peptidase SppA, partial [Prevotella sp.]
MKDFFKNVGATIVGLLVFTLILGAFALISIVGMIAGASNDSKPSIPSNSVLVLQMKGSLDERSTSSPLSFFNQDQTQPMG